MILESRILKNNEVIRVYEKGFNLESDPDKFIFKKAA